MTPSGDHGGDSTEEVEAALFMYSKRPLWNPGFAGLRRREGAGAAPLQAEQIGLAPTLALLLGLPIPFGSLGSIIPEVFAMPSSRITDIADGVVTGGGDTDTNDTTTASLLLLGRATTLVSQSIRRYLQTYEGTATDLDGRIAGSTLYRI